MLDPPSELESNVESVIVTAVAENVQVPVSRSDSPPPEPLTASNGCELCENVSFAIVYGVDGLFGLSRTAVVA